MAWTGQPVANDKVLGADVSFMTGRPARTRPVWGHRAHQLPAGAWSPTLRASVRVRRPNTIKNKPVAPIRPGVPSA